MAEPNERAAPPSFSLSFSQKPLRWLSRFTDESFVKAAEYLQRARKAYESWGGGSRKVQDVVDEQMMTGYVDHSSAYDK